MAFRVLKSGSAGLWSHYLVWGSSHWYPHSTFILLLYSLLVLFLLLFNFWDWESHWNLSLLVVPAARLVRYRGSSWLSFKSLGLQLCCWAMLSYLRILISIQSRHGRQVLISLSTLWLHKWFSVILFLFYIIDISTGIIVHSSVYNLYFQEDLSLPSYT